MESPFLTGLGLAAPAGLNAYLPLLVLALADRMSTKVSLGEPYNVLSSTWGILALLVLLGIEIIVDKIPGLDHANDLLQSVIRPASGAFLMMSENSRTEPVHPLVAMIIGLLVAGSVHAAKTVSRPAVTVSTGGLGNPIVSMVEDGISLIASVLAIIAPVIALLIFILLGVGLIWSYRTVRRVIRRSRDRRTQARPTLRQ